MPTQQMPKLPPMPGTPDTGPPLVPQQLQFGTPGSGSGSPSSSLSSQLTPQLKGLNLSRGHGRPRKMPEPPNYDDFPAGAFQEEID